MKCNIYLGEEMWRELFYRRIRLDVDNVRDDLSDIFNAAGNEFINDRGLTVAQKFSAAQSRFLDNPNKRDQLQMVVLIRAQLQQSTRWVTNYGLYPGTIGVNEAQVLPQPDFYAKHGEAYEKLLRKVHTDQVYDALNDAADIYDAVVARDILVRSGPVKPPKRAGSEALTLRAVAGP